MYIITCRMYHFCLSLDGDHRDRHVLTHSFPTRRSSDLDSLASLASFADSIDLFINDSDHSRDYERREYECIESKLADGGLILGDNAHATDVLMLFSEERGRRFLFAKEQPLNHWYRSEEHTSELQSLMRISYAVFCLKQKNNILMTCSTQQPSHTPSLQH